MQHIQFEVEITASPLRVWRVLADFTAYPEWNPFVRAISGEQVVGSRLSVTIQPVGGKAMSFKPTLLAFDPQKELRWKGQLLMPGIFDGEHYFRLVETSAETVRVTQGEVFSGLLVPLVFRGSMRVGTERGFAALNQALKARAEAPR
jgi:hypothetical protein